MLILHKDVGVVVILVLFYFSFFTVIYTYVLYPLLIYIITRAVKKKIIRIDHTPTVTQVIAARNEEAVIEDKIKNSLELDYPSDKLEIMVVSDHSTDATNEIVSRYADRVKLLALPERHGKTKAQNVAVTEATGDIIVFSDANAEYAPDAIQQMVKHYSNPDVAFVSGQLIYTNRANASVSNKENVYWRYDKFIKRSENVLGCITGANGSIYSVRKSAYVPLEYDMISDFIEPLAVHALGGRVVYEPLAKSYEAGSQTYSEEFGRRKRIILRSINSLFRHAYLLNPFKTGILAFELISHKVLRWFCPVFMILLLISNLVLLGPVFYNVFFILQLLFYFTATMGVYLRKAKSVPSIVMAPYYFTLINYASLLAIVDYAKGKNKVFWEPTRSN